MQCSSCGSTLPEGADRCPSCGVVWTSPDRPEAPATVGDEQTDVTRLPAAGSAVVISGHLAAGARIANRYRIEQRIGAGGMGTVYRALDCELDLPVALKLIRPDLLDDPASGQQFLERFKRELLTARAVTHRNVLRIHDLGDDAGRKFITMPFVEGRDLHAVLTERRLPFSEVLDYGRQLAAGLAAAHEAGIVHRDLKPQNVLVGADGTVYISDFGLAKSLEASGAGMTRTGEFVGTPQYISPEQVEGRPADHRSDLYALGIMLYEMACGRVPFAAPSALETMLARLRALPPPPQLIEPTVPEYFSRIVMRCLEKDAAARYQRAAEVLEDLKAGRAPVARAARPDRRRPRRRMAGFAVAGTALLALVLFAIPRADRDGSPAETASAGATAGVTAPLRLAVLPFTAAAGDESLEVVATGLREWLAAKLVQLDSVVLSSASAVDAAVSRNNPVDVAGALGVTVLVGGTVQALQDAVRVTVYAEDVSAGTRLWAREYSWLHDDTLALQDRVVHDLIEGLKLGLTNEEQAATVERPTGSIEAYELYARGRQAMRHDQDLANVERALELFEQARTHDPRFALAYAGIADASLRLYRARREPARVQQALAAAQQAISADDTRAEAHSALGNVFQATGRTHEAIVQLKRAAELAPNSDEAYRRVGRAYLDAGERDEAFTAYRRAIAINPYHWVNHGQLGAALLESGDFPAAVEAFREVIELEPRNAVGFSDLGVAHFLNGELQAAIAAFERAIALDPKSDAHSNLGAAYAYLGEYDRAIAPLEQAVRLNPQSEVEIGNLADVYRLSGRSEQAREAYGKAVALALEDLKVNPEEATVKQRLALYYAKLGEHRRAARLISDAKQSAAGDGEVLYAEALVLSFAGKTDAALASLREALDAGYSRAAVEHDPDAKPLRDLPGYPSRPD